MEMVDTSGFQQDRDSVTEQELSRRARRRLAIIRHAQEVTGNVALTRRYYGISCHSYDRWFRRYQAEGLDGLRDCSERPLASPRATNTQVVAKIIYLRQHYHFRPAKIAMYPSATTTSTSALGVWRILKRLGMNRWLVLDNGSGTLPPHRRRGVLPFAPGRGH
jgi:transposase